MSCKVFEPDSPTGAGPVPWRQLNAGGPKASKEPPPPDAAARVEQLRRELEQKAREAQAAGFREGEAAGRSRAAAEFQAGRRAVRADHRRARANARAPAPRGRGRHLETGARHRPARAAPRAGGGSRRSRRLVLGALEKLRGQEISRVRVHPSHATLIADCLRKGFPGAAIEVIPDGGKRPEPRSSKPSGATWMPRSNRSCRRSNAAWRTACGTSHERNHFPGALLRANSTASRRCAGPER